MKPTNHFAASYAAARERFLASAGAAGLGVTSHAIDGVRGAQGEELAMDVVRVGDPHADKLLVLTSAIHGVEGFCGSGCQSAMLVDEPLLATAERMGVGLLFVHAVNPFGFSHLRRVNEDNVDVNRNFVRFDEARSPNHGYAELEPLLLPPAWPPGPEEAARLDAWIAAHGVEAYGQSVFQGQYDSPTGMFYGGSRATWSNRTIRRVLRQEGAAAKQVGWIDLHTGLGPRGHCEKVFIGRAGEIDRARTWWGADVISTERDDSVMYEISGPMVTILAQECPHALGTTIALEFGTVPLLRMIDALRADHFCWRGDPSVAPRLKAEAGQELKACFYVDDADWQGMVFGQARTAVVQALCGLGASA